MACQCSKEVVIPCGLKPNPELIAVFRLREKHANFNLYYWKTEYAIRGDRFAKECWLEAERLYLQIDRILRLLNDPTSPTPSIEQKP